MSNEQGGQGYAVALAQESLDVSKQVVSTGSVRLSTYVEEHIERVEGMLLQTEVDMERIPIDRVVDAIPQIRTEGDTLVYPIVEEILVKQLVLREEVRITHRQHSKPYAQDVTLRRVRADIEHVPTAPRPETSLEQP